ncbi:isovaleryl-CoA dehydrogenase [Thermomonas paludicola]|uniref:isovaleryl-CoA dehydrogenase n=1 Tax=Thermomonas paludicola TaxID=2884874 RepID=UPI0021152A6E|nr:isovaleryl-CoA dehydrogenase [Thermomonas paludicola]
MNGQPTSDDSRHGAPGESFATHAPHNLPQPLGAYDAFSTDSALRESLHRHGAGWADSDVAAYGRVAGGELMELGALANQHRPQLRLFDVQGRRLDQVEFHPAYHRIMGLAFAHGVPNFAWRNETKPGAHVARAALVYLHAQAEQGSECPLTMTYASVPALRQQPQVADEWLPRVLSAEYDPRFLPAAHKAAATIGMGMTEKQGGSDVRSNTTRATAVSGRGPGAWYELVGHKWFVSAPMSDAFLVLAQSAGGLSCFLLPRFAPDGTVNAIRIQQLKDKLGDWSNASAEVELQGALAMMVGGEGRGVATILEMVALTRLDCMLGSAALMRQSLVQALHYTPQRMAFGKRLGTQPLMQNVLADLALESEAALALALRVARAVDAAPRDPREAAFARLATAIGKYWVCKRCTPFVNEAQETFGGIGYIEGTMMPRLYRQAPLNSIWEGSGNIQCLDVLRTLAREPLAREVLFDELELARGGHPDFDHACDRLRRELGSAEPMELRARALTEQMALALQAAQLIQAGQAEVTEAFCQSRLGREHGLAFGTLPAQMPMASD